MKWVGVEFPIDDINSLYFLQLNDVFTVSKHIFEFCPQFITLQQ
jgi:hypothetical protein